MKTNVGSYDGAVRFVAGCALLAMGNHHLGWWGLIGLAPILSSVTGFCPLYALLHLRTTACDHDTPPPAPRIGLHWHEHFSQPAGHARRLGADWHRPPSV